MNESIEPGASEQPLSRRSIAQPDDSPLTAHPSLFKSFGPAVPGAAERPPLSPARLRANRRNAKKSTGPRTLQGKARSSRNALKHGLLARTAPAPDDLQGEDAAIFEEFLDTFREIYNPVGPAQERLVQHAAHCQLRLVRAYRFETKGALQHQAALRASARRDAETKLSDLDRRTADAERNADTAALARLSAERASVQQAYDSRLENARLLGSLPDRDKLTALLRYEGSINREWRRIVRQLNCFWREEDIA